MLFVFDALLRQRISTTVNWVYLAAMPVPPWGAVQGYYAELARCAARLSCTTPELASFWDAAFPHQPWSYACAERDAWQRAELRAHVDAIVAELYGLSPSELGWMLTAFPLLDRDQPPIPREVFAKEGEARASVVRRPDRVRHPRDQRLPEREPRSFVTRDLLLLRYFERRNDVVPEDVSDWFRHQVGLDPDRPVSPLRIGNENDLRKRVEQARSAGAAAYAPSLGERARQRALDKQG